VHRLKNAFKGERAAVIFGGPSLVDQQFDFAALRRRGFVVFLESKSLTPRFLESGIQPDFYLMPFPDKCKDNTLQSTVFRGFLAGVDVSPFLKREWRATARDLKQNFDRYYEHWRPHRGPHKRFRFRPDAYLPGSPFDLLTRLDRAKLIVHRRHLAEHFPSFSPGERAHVFDTLPPDGPFAMDRYFDVAEQDGVPHLRTFAGVLNSAAIAVYPLLHYMGFREVYGLGMDMSMLGTMEYAVPYTFSSMLAFRWFFFRTRHVFNAAYRPNRPYFYRPASEFEDLRQLMAGTELKIVRVHRPWKYAADIPGIPTVSPQEFLTA
jgi:hypothetical protein